MKLCPFVKMVYSCFLIRRGDECNGCTSNHDKAAEEEKKKKSVDFDCESGAHNRRMKSKW